MSVCIIGAGGGGVNRVERIIFPAGRTENVKKAFFSYILLGKPACDMVSFAWKAARTAAAACETGRAVCGCGAVKGPVVPWNGEQGRIAALNFVSLRFCAFFVAAVFVYYVLPRRARQPWLLACSCFFYMCWNPAYIVLILFSAFSTYLCGRALAVLGAPAAGNRGRRRAAMAVSLAANLGILFFFKYYNFFAQSANGLLAARGFPAVPLLGVLLPVGISFYTFQAIGYTVDVYRGSVSAEQRFWRYLLFISFFPQLVAGPIERSGNILPQLQLPARFSYERAKSGLVLMLWGYIQKMVVADRLALLADTVYAQGGALGGWATAAATVLFCFELYCDFSSYTDIARGAARILGVELMENFRSPFLSQSVAEFWRNWHISLSSFFRDYLYIPLGGSRRGLARTCVNTMVVFLCSGLWHGAAWTFVAWGLLHGLYLVCGRLTLPLRKRLYTALRVPYGCLPARLWRTAWTFALVAFSLIFFRAGGMDAALSRVRSLLRPGAFPGREAVLAWGMDGPDLLLSAVCAAAVVLCDVLRRRWGSLSARLLQKPLAVQWAVLLAGVLTVAIFGMYGEGYVEKPFIYFQF